MLRKNTLWLANLHSINKHTAKHTKDLVHGREKLQDKNVKTVRLLIMNI